MNADNKFIRIHLKEVHDEQPLRSCMLFCFSLSISWHYLHRQEYVE